jgi:hypothetical protein
MCQCKKGTLSQNLQKNVHAGRPSMK